MTAEFSIVDYDDSLEKRMKRLGLSDAQKASNRGWELITQIEELVGSVTSVEAQKEASKEQTLVDSQLAERRIRLGLIKTK